MSSITTHILDTSAGKPAAGVSVLLENKSDSDWKIIGNGTTNNDGRISNLITSEKKTTPGIYRLTFETGSYFKSRNIKCFYPNVIIEFEITDESHYHVPLLMNPFGYSTYRGS